MKKLIILTFTTISITLTLLLLNACSSLKEAEFFPASDPNARGNTNGNLANDGEFAFDDEYIYFVVYEDDKNTDGIYKIAYNGDDFSPKVRISEEAGFCLNVVDNWIYYLSSDEKRNIYRMDSEGKNKSKLSDDDNCVSISVIGDWIYYVWLDNSRNVAEYSLCKIRTDGAEKSILVEKRAQRNFCVADDGYIYYEAGTYSSSDGVRRVIYDYAKAQTSEDLTTSDAPPPSGSASQGLQNEAIIEKAPSSFTVEGDFIYCAVLNSESYRIKTDGTQKQTLPFEKAIRLNVDGDAIYYLDLINNSLCKANLDGSGIEVLCEARSFGVSVIGDWLFYHDYALNETYRIKKDGTLRMVVG